MEAFIAWFGTTKAKMAKMKAEFIYPKLHDYKALSEDVNASEFGRYTLNPWTQMLVHGQHEFLILEDLSQFNGRPIHEVMKYVMEAYHGKCNIPGIELWVWLHENEDKIPDKLKDGNCYHLPGSLLRDSDGHWCVPVLRWADSKKAISRGANSLTDLWKPGYHALLVK